MAGKGTKNRVPSAKTARFNDFQFIQFELSKDAVDALKKEANDGNKILDMAQQCIDSGYRISLKHDERGDCYSCFMQPNDEDHEFFGYILPSRGSTLLKAVKQLMYKHFVSFEGDWSNAQSFAANPPIDD